MGSNTVLTAIYTALLNVIEHESGKPWRLAHYSAPRQALTSNRRVVDAIASRDTKRLTFLQRHFSTLRNNASNSVTIIIIVTIITIIHIITNTTI